MEHSHIPYRSLGIIENKPGEFLMVKRRGQDLWSYVGGKESSIDYNKPRNTMIREGREEAGIDEEKIELSNIRYSFSYRQKMYYIFVGKMKKIDNFPGYISHDEDIEYYQWLPLDKIKMLPLTEIDYEIYCWHYNYCQQLKNTA